jgi:hypothetical protein
MAIGRMQMNRQLYGLGGYFPPENGREKFGLGSKLKKFVRKIIPNEVSEIAVKAAPFVAPFNPLLAGYMAGIGGFDQTGRIGSSLKSGLLTYGGGQLARGIGGAGFQEGFNPFSNVSFFWWYNVWFRSNIYFTCIRCSFIWAVCYSCTTSNNTYSTSSLQCW